MIFIPGTVTSCNIHFHHFFWECTWSSPHQRLEKHGRVLDSHDAKQVGFGTITSNTETKTFLRAKDGKETLETTAACFATLLCLTQRSIRFTWVYGKKTGDSDPEISRQTPLDDPPILTPKWVLNINSIQAKGLILSHLFDSKMGFHLCRWWSWPSIHSTGGCAVI